MHYIFGGESLSCDNALEANPIVAAPFCVESCRAPRAPRVRTTKREDDDGERGPVSAQYRMLRARVLSRCRAAEDAGRLYVSLSSRDLADRGSRKDKAIWLPHATVRAHQARLRRELQRRGYCLDRGGPRGGYRVVLPPPLRESKSPQIEHCPESLRVRPRSGTWARKFTRPRLAPRTGSDAQGLGDIGGVELRSKGTPSTFTPASAGSSRPAGDVIAARIFPADWGKAFTSARSVLAAIRGACPEISAERAQSKPADAKTVRQWRARRTPQPGPWPAALEVGGLAHLGLVAARQGIAEAKWERWCILAAQIAQVGWRDGIVCAPAGFVIGTLRQWLRAGRAARTKGAPSASPPRAAAERRRVARPVSPPSEQASPANALPRESGMSILASLKRALMQN